MHETIIPTNKPPPSPIANMIVGLSKSAPSDVVPLVVVVVVVVSVVVVVVEMGSITITNTVSCELIPLSE